MNDAWKPQIADEVMTADPVCVSEGADLVEIVGLMEMQDISGLPVVDAKGLLVGVVSKSDVLAALVGALDTGDQPLGRSLNLLRTGEHRIDWSVTAKGLSLADPVTARPQDSLASVARQMAQGRVHRVVIVDDEGRPLGIVTSMDVVDAFPR